jgi:hypothetical protein
MVLDVSDYCRVVMVVVSSPFVTSPAIECAQ